MFRDGAWSGRMPPSFFSSTTPCSATCPASALAAGVSVGVAAAAACLLLLAVGIAAMRGPGVNSAVVAISIVYTPLFARVMRGPVLAEREKDYVQAVRALGATRLAVALKHVLPNVISPFVIQGTVAFSQAILIEASLSYLGLSAQPPTPSWGNMLNEGRTYLETAPWISVFPGIAIMLSVLAFNLIGDGLRDILDPNVQ